MKKIHIVVLAIVMLLMVSLVFAQQGQETFVTGEVSAAPTANGVIVQGEQMAVTVPIQGRQGNVRPAARKPAVHHVQTVNQQAAGAKATQVQNAASLKKGESKLKVDTTTTQTDHYNVSVTNKKGTTDYGMVEQTVTNPQGKQTTDGVIYSSYQPSKAARANDEKMEVSLAAGTVMSYNKDNQNDRYGSMGLAAGLTALYDVSDHLAFGLDYMMLHPRAKTHGDGANERRYHGMYAHDISLAGKLALNPWDNFQVYIPMGAGMMNARMKTRQNGVSDNHDKWGASLYAGLGMQYDITYWMFAGLEYRYTYGFISDKDLTPLHKDRNLQFHTFMFRMGMRF